MIFIKETLVISCLNAWYLQDCHPLIHHDRVAYEALISIDFGYFLGVKNKGMDTIRIFLS